MIKKLIPIGFTFLFFFGFFLSGCGPRHYTPQQLNNIGAKTVEGYVSLQSLGGFVLTDQAAQEISFRTGEMTQYIPEGYRSQKNDVVKVTFTETPTNSGEVKRTVLQLESLKVPDENRLPSEFIEGVLVSKYRSSFRYVTSFYLRTESDKDPYVIFISNSESKVIVDGKPVETAYFNFDKILNKKVQVNLSYRPILRGNAYIILATNLIVLEQ